MASEPLLPILQTKILIPAYNKEKKGLTFELLMEATPSPSLKIAAQGAIALGLEKMLSRTISIMSNLNESWQRLSYLNYTLTSTEDAFFCVKDARSASLPLSIALINILRQLKGLDEVQALTGTGLLRVDGTFEKAWLEKEKKQAASQIMENKFVHSASCNHLFDLACLMKC